MKTHIYTKTGPFTLSYDRIEDIVTLIFPSLKMRFGYSVFSLISLSSGASNSIAPASGVGSSVCTLSGYAIDCITVADLDNAAAVSTDKNPSVTTNRLPNGRVWCKNFDSKPPFNVVYTSSPIPAITDDRLCQYIFVNSANLIARGKLPDKEICSVAQDADEEGTQRKCIQANDLERTKTKDGVTGVVTSSQENSVFSCSNESCDKKKPFVFYSTNFAQNKVVDAEQRLEIDKLCAYLWTEFHNCPK